MEEQKKPYYAYKGVKTDLSTYFNKGHNGYFVFDTNPGLIYKKSLPELTPKICTNEGYHFCDKLSNVLQFFPCSNGTSRYFKIEVLGKFSDSDSSGKRSTTSFRFVEELSQSKVQEILKAESFDQRMDSARIDIIDLVVEKFPDIIITGSIALIMQGIDLDREFGDIDFVYHKYINIREELEYSSGENVEDLEDLLVSEVTEYDRTQETLLTNCIIDNKKIELSINPHQKYIITEFMGKKYRVVPYLEILSHKMKYAMSGRDKDIQDFKQIINFNNK